MEWSLDDKNQDLDSRLYALGSKQVEFRTTEIYEAYHTFMTVVSSINIPPGNIVDGLPSNDARAWLSCMNKTVKKDSVILMGHSFGATTVVSQPVVLFWRFPILINH